VSDVTAAIGMQPARHVLVVVRNQSPATLDANSLAHHPEGPPMPSRQLAVAPRAGSGPVPSTVRQLTARPVAAFRGREVPVWLSLVALAVGGFAIGTTEFASMGVLPDIAGDLGVSIPTAGHAITAYALGVVVGAPTFAILGARLPRKGLLLVLVVALSVANLASALAPTFATFELARFASGLPHGAYFGIGAVVASSLVPRERRARAVAMTMMGLTVANVVGVPLTTLLGQAAGWRSIYLTVVAIGLLTLVAVGLLVPRVVVHEGASPRREISALRRPQVWLTLLVGAVGFGGFFAVYSYITPTLTEVSGFANDAVPLALALFGVGMTLGTMVGGRLADWSVLKTLVFAPVATLTVQLLFTVTAHGRVTAAATLLVLAFTSSLSLPAITARLLDVAGDGKALASTLNHSALNVANALGAWLGGLVIAAGYGWTSPAAVGAVLSAGGLVVLAVSIGLERRDRQRDGDAREEPLVA
jgi:DHA1 family inner membrane transport protein